MLVCETRDVSTSLLLKIEAMQWNTSIKIQSPSQSQSTNVEGKINSLRKIARIGGVLYLLIIILGLFGEFFVRSKLIATGDPTATAVKIAQNDLLWRIGIAGELVLLICGVGLGVIFYQVLKPVNRKLALLVVFFNLVSIAVEVTSSLFLLAPLLLSGESPYLKTFEPSQLNALMQASLRMHEFGFGISLIFFGCVCIVVGYLIFKSGYIPKLIGILMAIAGFCYLVNSFAMILAPSLASTIFPVILVPPFIGEFSLCLWLLLRGVKQRLDWSTLALLNE
jgi:hypothetical protein